MDRIEVKFAAEEIDAKTGEFSGYGAVFGNIDSHGDVIAPGAFAETLADWAGRGRLPSMKLMHGTALNPFSGDDLPLGVWRMMREDVRGLYVEGKLSAIETDFGKRIHALMKDGALAGLSIGYKAKRFSRPPAGSQAKRILDAIHLGEISLVDNPSNDRSRVSAVKSLDTAVCRAIEAELRADPELKLSNANAVSVLAIVKKHLREGGDLDPAKTSREADEAAIAAILRRNIATLNAR